MKSVYLVQHSYEYDDCEETKIIGIYSSKEKAELAVEKCKKLPGFKHYSDCFFIDEYDLDVSHWQEGFFKALWDMNTKPPEDICPKNFCFIWSENERRCRRTFGICKREEPDTSNYDWYEPCESELEKFGLPWFYFIPSEEKLVEQKREEYSIESKKLWGA